MKLSEIIAKYEPLGWKFEFVETSLDDFWTYKSPRMSSRKGFPWVDMWSDNPESSEIDEEEMLKSERDDCIRSTYEVKISEQFRLIKEDIIRQMKLCDERHVAIPQEFNVSFDLKLK